jgi:hypothetical protein
LARRVSVASFGGEWLAFLFSLTDTDADDAPGRDTHTGGWARASFSVRSRFRHPFRLGLRLQPQPRRATIRAAQPQPIDLPLNENQKRRISLLGRHAFERFDWLIRSISC